MLDDEEFDGGWIIESKFEPSTPKIDLVDRQRLLKLLDDAITRKLGLVVAPAGFGKSTLLCQWFAELDKEGRKAAWLTLDENDADERQFLSYVAIALSYSGVDIGDLEIGARDGFSEVPAGRVLGSLMQRLQRDGQITVLLLDDYHLVADSKIDGLVCEMLKQAPSNFTLVINSRTLPGVDVPMMVAAGEGLEIGADQIRMTREEAISALGDDFDAEEAAQIYGQTEGWPVAVQLARVQKQTRPSSPVQLAAPSGLVAAYLTNQLLSTLDEDLREFLLAVSALDRFNAELADHIRDETNSRQLIERLQPLTALLVSMDYEGNWYRLHHLFAEYLRDTLRKESTTRLQEVQIGASEWFSNQGQLIEAVRYAVLAKDFGECERLILAAGGWKVILTDGIGVMRSLFRLLPESIVSSSSRLLVARAYLHCKDGEYASARGLLDVSVVLRSEKDGDSFDTDFRVIESMVNAYEDRREWVIAKFDEDSVGDNNKFDDLEAGMVASERIMVNFAMGAFDRGDEAVRSAFSFFRQSGSVLGLNYCYLHAATAALHRADMDLARANVNQALELAESNFGSDSGLKHLAQVIDHALHVWKGESGREDIEEFSKTLSYIEEYDGWVEIYILGVDAAYHLAEQVGDGEFAADVTARFLKVAKSRNLERLELFCNVLQIRAAARLGQKTDATKHMETVDGWLINAPPDEEPRSWHAYFLAAETRATARLTSSARTLDTLRKSIQFAEKRGLTLHLVRLMVAESIALRQLDRKEASTERLIEAISLAAKRNLAGPFLCDDSLKRLLKEIRSELRHQDDELLHVNFVTDTLKRSNMLRPRLGSDILSVREHEILEQLALGLSNKEIARRFQLTENTVKFHLKSLYKKLEVGRRTQAIAAARQKNLID